MYRGQLTLQPSSSSSPCDNSCAAQLIEVAEKDANGPFPFPRYPYPPTAEEEESSHFQIVQTASMAGFQYDRIPFPCSIAVIKSNGDRGKVFEFEKTWCLLGAHSDCDICLQSTGGPPLHAFVFVTEKGVHLQGIDRAVPVVHPRSDAMLVREQEVLLKPNDVFFLGDRAFRVEFTPPPTQSAGIPTSAKKSRSTKKEQRKAMSAGKTARADATQRRSSIVVGASDEQYVEPSQETDKLLSQSQKARLSGNPAPISCEERSTNQADEDSCDYIETNATIGNFDFRLQYESESDGSECPSSEANEDEPAEAEIDTARIADDDSDDSTMIADDDSNAVADANLHHADTKLRSGTEAAADIVSVPEALSMNKAPLHETGNSPQPPDKNSLPSADMTSRERRNLSFLRLSKGLPATPSKREITPPFDKYAVSTDVTVAPVMTPGRTRIMAPSDKENIAQTEHTLDAVEKNNKAPEKKSNTCTLSPRAPDCDKPRHEDSSRPKSKSSAAKPPVRTPPTRKVLPRTPREVLGLTPRSRSVAFASKIELGAGPHYSPYRPSRSARQKTPIPRFGSKVSASKQNKPLSARGVHKPAPRPSPSPSKNRRATSISYLEGPPPSSGLGRIGKFLFPSQAQEQQEQEADSVRENSSAAVEDLLAQDDDEISRDDTPAPSSRSSFGHPAFSNAVASLFRRISANFTDEKSLPIEVKLVDTQPCPQDDSMTSPSKVAHAEADGTFNEETEPLMTNKELHNLKDKLLPDSHAALTSKLRDAAEAVREVSTHEGLFPTGDCDTESSSDLCDSEDEIDDIFDARDSDADSGEIYREDEDDVVDYPDESTCHNNSDYDSGNDTVRRSLSDELGNSICARGDSESCAENEELEDEEENAKVPNPDPYEDNISETQNSEVSADLTDSESELGTSDTWENLMERAALEREIECETLHSGKKCRQSASSDLAQSFEYPSAALADPAAVSSPQQLKAEIDLSDACPRSYLSPSDTATLENNGSVGADIERSAISTVPSKDESSEDLPSPVPQIEDEGLLEGTGAMSDRECNPTEQEVFETRPSAEEVTLEEGTLEVPKPSENDDTCEEPLSIADARRKYNAMKVVELRSKCKLMGLATHGLKKVIVERLARHEIAPKENAEDKTVEPPSINAHDDVTPAEVHVQHDEQATEKEETKEEEVAEAVVEKKVSRVEVKSDAESDSEVMPEKVKNVKSTVRTPRKGLPVVTEEPAKEGTPVTPEEGTPESQDEGEDTATESKAGTSTDIDLGLYREKTVKELRQYLKQRHLDLMPKLRKEELISHLVSENIGPNGEDLNAEAEVVEAEATAPAQQAPAPVTPAAKTPARKTKTPSRKTPGRQTPARSTVLQKKTVAQLRAMLKESGLCQVGTKPLLLERLQNNPTDTRTRSSRRNDAKTCDGCKSKTGCEAGS